MISDSEKASFGFLGKIPDEVINGNRDIVSRYKKLAERAKRVAWMQPTVRKVELAKKVERDYYALIADARKAGKT
jgi:hypothetical protein